MIVFYKFLGSTLKLFRSRRSISLLNFVIWIQNLPVHSLKRRMFHILTTYLNQRRYLGGGAIVHFKIGIWSRWGYQPQPYIVQVHSWNLIS